MSAPGAGLAVQPGPGAGGAPGARAPDSQPHVVVVGGGLAGISAALACADAGAGVTLLEKRSRLGGLTWSFTHDGLQVDNGQHVFLRCCTAYLDFLGRIGSAGDVELQERLDVTVLRAGPSRPGGPGSWVPPAGVDAARLSRDRVPAPLHLTPPWTSRPSRNGCARTVRARSSFRRCGTSSACPLSTCRLAGPPWPWRPRSSKRDC
jgi:choline dehydrogenase-like flavoprotein